MLVCAEYCPGPGLALPWPTSLSRPGSKVLAASAHLSRSFFGFRPSDDTDGLYCSCATLGRLFRDIEARFTTFFTSGSSRDGRGIEATLGRFAAEILDKSTLGLSVGV